jgi:PAS domain S-box-containing protein
MADQENWDDLRAKIIGLGELSSRKSYYPELRQKLSDLERFRALLDIAADGIFQAEAPDGTIIEINQAAASLFQCKRSDLIGKSIYQFFSNQVSSEIREFNTNVTGINPDSISIETSIPQNDGSRLIVDLGVQVSIFDTKRYFVITAHNITERIAYQKKLRISEMNMSSIFDSTYDAIIIHDKIGNIIEVNSAMLKSFEVSYEQALQLQIPQISATEEQLNLLPAVWENVLAGEPAIFEWNALRPITKTTFIAEVALKKVFWKGKTEIVAVVRDITARKKIEKDLYQANQFNEEIIAGAGEGIVVYDTNFCYQLWNPLMEKIIGIKETEVLGKKAAELFPHITGKGIDTILQRIVDGEKELSLEFDFYVPQNGRKGWIDATYMPRHDYNGNVIGIIATMRDVTERRRAEEALRESESLLRTLIENAPFEIWARNKEGVGILENKTIVAHFGSILGKKPQHSEVDKNEPDHRNVNHQRAFNGEIVDNETEYTIHGEKRFFQQIVAPIVNDGRIEGIAGFNIDITNRKLAEIEINRANRVYALTSKINQMIIQAHDSQTIFNESCRIAVEYGRFRMVWIGLLDDEIQDIKPVTWFGYEDGYLSFLQKITVLRNSVSQGPIALSIREGKAHFTSDFATDPLMSPWRDEALKRGYRSVAALPLKVGGKVIGSFIMYASEPSFFNASEIKLLEEVTDNIDYALDMLEVEKRKHEAEMAYLKERLFTDAVIDSVPGLLYLYDENGYLQRWNKKHIEITGYSAEELDQFYVLDWFKDDPEDCEGIKNEIKKTLEVGFGSIEAQLTTKNGLKISFYLTAVKLVIDDKVYFTGIGIDVTERKKALEALVYNEQRLRILSEASFEGIVFSENTIVIDTNEQLLTILGRSKEEIIGHTILEFVASESLEKVRSKITDNSEEAYEL